MNASLRFLACASFGASLLLSQPAVHADENLFGRVRGAETLPAGKADIYQYFTLRTGKDSGSYHAWDFDTEFEYGITNELQVGVSLTQHYFHVRDNAELGDIEGYQFGGAEVSAKYRVLSPFKDPIGLAFRLETGYLSHDDVGGFDQEEILVSPEVLVQKNFFDDTLILAANLGVEWAWGKQPAEEYNKEVSFDGALGVSYRFAPNWFAGVEGRIRSEYPLFDLGFHEHTVVFVGPALHYGSEKWWATFSYGYQIWGTEVDPTVSGKAYAEEARNEFRLKLGWNF
ncbi:MAG: hypothetical protein RL693_1799 [Verrucomicrobiota bacterium]|jgi:hypothetical protein